MKPKKAAKPAKKPVTAKKAASKKPIAPLKESGQGKGIGKVAGKNTKTKDVPKTPSPDQSKQEAVSESKTKRGRPTDYKPEYAEQGYKLCLMGATDAELADFFGVVESTINLWKQQHPEFSESTGRGKTLADAEISEALYHRAKGYSHPDVHISNYQGMITETPLIKHYPPDTAAASLWLRNRQSGKWRDKVDVDHGAQPGSSLDDLFKQIASSATNRVIPAKA